MTNFINWNAPIKEGRKNDMCPSCFSKELKRKGRHRRICTECDSMFINPNRKSNDKKHRQVEAATANRH